VASGAALAVGTTYYVKSISSSTFELYREVGLTTKLDFTTAGSSLVMQSAYRYALTTDEKARYGSAGSERIYASLSAWNTARSVASALDTEICEIGEAWSDSATTALSINVPAAELRIESKVNGVRTAAFHNGAIDAVTGYVWLQRTNGQDGLSLAVDNAQADGFTVAVLATWFSSLIFTLANFGGKATNMVTFGPGGTTSVGSYGRGINQLGDGVSIKNCVATGCMRGFYISQFATGLLVGNNTAINNGTGFYPQGATSMFGRYYNNISVGNTTNWGTAAGFTDAHCNAGLTTEAWTSSGRNQITIATTDFASYPTDLSPGAATSPQTDTGIEYYSALAYDVADDVRPNYIGSELDTTITAGSFVAGRIYQIVSVGSTSWTGIGAASSSSVTAATSDVITWTGHTLINGDVVYFSALVNGRRG
jgi:hypothetical protein